MKSDFRQLKTVVRARGITSMEELKEQTGLSVADIEYAFKGYPSEYQQMKREMRQNRCRRN
ncbi:MAG: hypothetical protein HFJ48_05885 [Clostridia bacterium]|nr:hypothetical protein [Clostridia bacterium]